MLAPFTLLPLALLVGRMPPPPHARAAIHASASTDFSGEWRMDLSASDALGPLLRELGLNRILAALITRLSVEQSITQTDHAVNIAVKTSLSTDTLELRLDGTPTLISGLTGGKTPAVSRWLDASRLETRQSLSDAPPDATADCFITVRSLGDGGTLLYEDCAVERGGAAVEGCRTRRILRRKT